MKSNIENDLIQIRISFMWYLNLKKRIQETTYALINLFVLNL